MAPGLDLGDPNTAFTMSSGIVHPPIVKTTVWEDEAATERFAVRLAAVPALGRAFIALHGDLGAGKTTLVRHLLRACGVQGRIKSPTYAVVESYELPGQSIWHFDFYRFSDPREWQDAGFRDIFASAGLKIAEWPEKAAACLPQADLDLYMTVLDETRRAVELKAHSDLGCQLLAALDDAQP